MCSDKPYYIPARSSNPAGLNYGSEDSDAFHGGSGNESLSPRRNFMPTDAALSADGERPVTPCLKVSRKKRLLSQRICGSLTFKKQYSTFNSQLTMFQIIFTPASAAELGRMPKELQLQILGEFRGLPQQVLGTELDEFGKLEQGGQTLHRFRVGDYRVYFERHELGVLVHRILSRNTLKDFLFRSGLKTGEDEALQENPKFWELIETAKGHKG